MAEFSFVFFLFMALFSGPGEFSGVLFVAPIVIALFSIPFFIAHLIFGG